MSIKNASDCEKCGSSLIEGDSAYCGTCHCNLQDMIYSLSRRNRELRDELDKEMSTNKFTQDKIGRGLILIYASRNAHGFVNFTLPCADLEDFCSSPDRKKELVLTLEVLAKKIEDEYVAKRDE